MFPVKLVESLVCIGFCGLEEMSNGKAMKYREFTRRYPWTVMFVELGAVPKTKKELANETYGDIIRGISEMPLTNFVKEEGAFDYIDFYYKDPIHGVLSVTIDTRNQFIRIM